MSERDYAPGQEIYLECGRYLCRPSAPYDAKRHGKRAAHQSAREIADYDETREMECRDCGAVWTEELPQ